MLKVGPGERALTRALLFVAHCRSLTIRPGRCLCGLDFGWDPFRAERGAPGRPFSCPALPAYSRGFRAVGGVSVGS